MEKVGLKGKDGVKGKEEKKIVFHTIFKVLSRPINDSAPRHVEGCVMKVLRYGKPRRTRLCSCVCDSYKVRKRCKKIKSLCII